MIHNKSLWRILLSNEERITRIQGFKTILKRFNTKQGIIFLRHAHVGMRSSQTIGLFIVVNIIAWVLSKYYNNMYKTVTENCDYNDKW